MTLLDSQRWVESSKTTDAATPVTLWDFSSLQSTAVTSDTLPSLSTSIEVNHRSCDPLHISRIRVGITVRFIVGVTVRITVRIRVRITVRIRIGITVRITVKIQFLESVLHSGSVSGLQSGLWSGLQIFSGLT